MLSPTLGLQSCMMASGCKRKLRTDSQKWPQALESSLSDLTGYLEVWWWQRSENCPVSVHPQTSSVAKRRTKHPPVDKTTQLCVHPALPLCFGLGPPATGPAKLHPGGTNCPHRVLQQIQSLGEPLGTHLAASAKPAPG